MNNKGLQKTTVFTLRLPLALIQKIRKLAEMESRTVANKMRLLLEEAVNGRAK